VAVLADGGHRTRSPEAGLELRLDLLTLDRALQDRGLAAPAGVARALDRLGAGTRFFTLADGRLAAFQGGQACNAARVAAAIGPEEAEGPRPADYAPHAGYQRLTARTLRVMVDTAAPAKARGARVLPPTPWRSR
jgi:uncharacterized heparinase superfamily protein